jgi:hypothetical protein
VCVCVCACVEKVKGKTTQRKYRGSEERVKMLCNEFFAWRT